jgi:Mrp family chromosome partitioning ATPase
MKTQFMGVYVRLAKALASLGLHVGVMAPDQWCNEPPTNQPSTTVLSEGVESIRPTSARSNVSATLERTLGQVRERYDCILLDLSGLDMLALKEVALVPEVGIVFFVVPGKLTEFALSRLRRQLPQERLLGAVFVDEEPGAGERYYGR